LKSDVMACPRREPLPLPGTSLTTSAVVAKEKPDARPGEVRIRRPGDVFQNPASSIANEHSVFLATLPERWSMIWKTTAVVVVALLVGLVAAKPDDKKKDEDKIQGTWQAVSMEEGGQKTPEDTTKLIKVVLSADGKFTVHRGAKEIKGTYQLDSTKKVKELTLKAEDGKMIQAIYKLDGDDLTICGVEDGQGDRPTEFATKADNKNHLIVFKREKK